jgi:hypothetical protein
LVVALDHLGFLCVGLAGFGDEILVHSVSFNSTWIR